MSTGFEQGGFDQTVPYDPFTMDDIDADKPGSGGGGKLPEGGYRFLVTEVIVQNEKGSTQVECEVVSAKDANLIGRKHTEYLKWPKAEYTEVGNRIAKEQLLAWCYATKTTSPDEIKARQQARQGFDASWLAAMVGRQLLGVIKCDTYTNAAGDEKTSAKLEGRVWAPDNPKGKGIPGWIDTTAAAGSGPLPPPQSPPSAPSDPFSGLV